MAGVFAHTLRPAILAAGRRESLRRSVERLPVTRRVVRRFVPGETIASALETVAALRRSGRYASIDYLGEDVTSAEDADAAVRVYVDLVDELGRREGPGHDGVAPLEVSVKLSALGQSLERDGEKIARENAWAICTAAQRVGVWVTVDAENHTTTDSTLSIVRDLRAEFPWLGTVLQAYLRRTPGDCAEFAAAGARIRLWQGRLRRTRVGGLPGRRRGHGVVSALPSAADGGPRVPDGSVARSGDTLRGFRGGR